MQELNELAFQHRASATPDEQHLLDNVLAWEEEYFEDITFKPDSIISPFIEYKIQDDAGNWVKQWEDPPDHIGHVWLLSKWRPAWYTGCARTGLWVHWRLHINSVWRL